MSVHGDQLVVHYSLSFGDAGRAAVLARQLDISLTTLRATNPGVSVVVFCHGTAPDPVRPVCDRHRAEFVMRPDPAERLGDELGEIGSILGRLGPVHKFLNFDELSHRGRTAAVYLDADTVVFGDLRRLAPDVGHPVLAAREEVGSNRCHFGVDPAYLDESRLAELVATVGIEPAPAFNTGVMVFGRFPFDRGPSIERRYVAWLVRFALWMADHPAEPRHPEYGDVFDLAALRTLLRGTAGGRLRRLAVEYPSVNRWLVEEAAAWVAFGAEPDIRIDQLDRRLVAQGGEPLDGPTPDVVWHYFSGNAEGMRRRLGLAADPRDRFGATHPTTDSTSHSTKST